MIINNKSIGVVILAYNVQNFIKRMVETLPDFVDNVYVVDDGSQDNTVRIVKSINRRNITLIQHDTNKGPGAALASGFKAALINKNDIVVKVDGDGQMSPDQIIHLIKPISVGFADYTKGDRLSNLDYRNNMPLIRLYGIISLDKTVNTSLKEVVPLNKAICLLIKYFLVNVLVQYKRLAL